jgi:transcriptional regulator with XRE-family HTH domain
VTNPRELSHGIGEFIRDLRSNARISLRQLAEQTGISNPYLSQIENGLRKPSAEVLQQIATALRVSTPLMYLRAGLLDRGDSPVVLDAITADEELTVSQKQTLVQIYETFRRENSREADKTVSTDATDSDVVVPPARARKKTTKES